MKCAGCGAEFVGTSPVDCLHGSHRSFDVDVLIGAEFYKVLQRFGAQSDLLGVIGSWGEGDLSSEEVLVYLRAYNGADREERADVRRRLAASRTIHPNSAV